MRKRLRIFISSPADVNEERLRAHLVIQKLARDYARFFQIEPYLWEHEPMLASGHFQDAIEPPSASDIVVLILYARLGTPLPEHTSRREYHGIDGRAPVTGTEWEFEEALAAHRAKGAPDLLAYRKMGDPGLSLTDPALRAEQERQWQSLEAFWRRHFENSGMFLAGSARFKTVEEFDQKLEADLTALIERRISNELASAGPADEARWFKGSPFRGLSAYEFEDAEIFFGRDAQTRLALTRLQSAAEGGCAFLLVLGASGSGKSSLARAGVLPALFVPKAIPGVGLWRRVVFRPADGGDDPIKRLALALASGDPALGIGLPEMLAGDANVDALASHLAASADDPTFPFRLALERVADQARRAGTLLPHESARLVILVDQFEELFTRAITPERRDLFLRILSALSRSGLVWVVATMRSDLWHRAAETKLLLELVEKGARLDVARPDAAELIEIIRRPASAAGLVFDIDRESGIALDAVIARAASEEPGVLPLLSVLLDTLYERDVATPRANEVRANKLTFETYRSLGELKGAIAQRADQALNALRERDPEAAASFPHVLRALVSVSQSGEAITSRPAPLDSFPEGSAEQRLIAAFLASDARLLVASAREGGAEVRLAHEALLENWPTARQQIQTDRRDLETRARIEALYRRWHNAPSGTEKKRALLRGLNLAEAVDLATRWHIPADSGLGGYVRSSARAERFRRSFVAGAAAAVALIFAAIAAIAGLESRRAEREAASARQAEQAERSARETAVEQRTEAVRQRERADQERGRALAALRQTKRQTAHTLAAQATAAAERNEFRRALTLAVQASETEREVLEPGERPVSEPALLKALAESREVLHVQRPTGGWPMLPHDFLGDAKLVYADPAAGLMIVDLDRPRVVARGKLPAGMVPTHVRCAANSGVVVVGGMLPNSQGGRDPEGVVVIFDTATGAMREHFQLPARVSALDIDEHGRAAAIGVGAHVGLLNLERPATPHLAPVPAPRQGVVVGQARFTAQGRSVFVGYGAAVFEFLTEEQRFSERQVMELTAETSGYDRRLVDSVNATGIVNLVEMRPDLTRDRVLTFTPLELQGSAGDGATQKFERETRDTIVLGVSFTDEGHTGSLKEAVAITARTGDTGQEFQIRYISDEPKLFAFERFWVSAADLGNEKPASCQVSRNVSNLVCHYRGKKQQGLIVWRLLAGTHRFERLLTTAASSGAVLAPDGSRTLVATESGPVLQPEDRPVSAASWNAEWRIVGSGGAYVIAASAAERKLQIFGGSGASGPVQQVLDVSDGAQAAVDPATGRAVVAGADRLTAYDLKTRQRLWMVPGLAGLKAVALAASEGQVAAATEDAAYVFDAENGRIGRSFPIRSKSGTPVAFNAAGQKLAYIAEDGVRLLDLASGRNEVLWPDTTSATQLAITPDGRQVFLGRADGTVLASTVDGQERYTISSPLEQAFETSPWPDQPPKGTVLQLAVSRNGERLAIVRQDIGAVDIHLTSSGRQLTQLTSPRIFWVPAQVAFEQNDLVLTSWAVHAMARNKPRRVEVHAIPRTFEDALAAAQARLAALRPWTPEGPPVANGAPTAN